jgi:hypothetical protein
MSQLNVKAPSEISMILISGSWGLVIRYAPAAGVSDAEGQVQQETSELPVFLHQIDKTLNAAFWSPARSLAPLTLYPSSTGTGTPSSTRSQASTFAEFAGTWIGHDKYLEVSADGQFTMSRRSFTWCDVYDPPPCDSMSGNEILYGNNASGQLVMRASDEATGVITESTDAAGMPIGKIVIRFDSLSDIITAEGDWYCGPDARPGACGA